MNNTLGLSSLFFYVDVSAPGLSGVITDAKFLLYFVTTGNFHRHQRAAINIYTLNCRLSFILPLLQRYFAATVTQFPPAGRN